MHAPDHIADSADEDALIDRRRAAVEAIVVGAAMAAVVAIALAGLWAFTRHSLEQNYRGQLTALAQSAAVQVDPALHRRVRTGGGDRRFEYLQAIVPLRRLQTAVPGIRHVHTFALEGDHARLVLDIDQGRDHSFESLALASPDDPRPAVMLAALGWQGAQPAAGATRKPYRDGRRAFMTGYAPIYDAGGRVEGVVAVDYDAADYLAHFDQGRERMLQSLLPAMLIVLLLAYAVFGLRLRSLTAARAAAWSAAEARRAAREDKLTGLANRTAFVEQLQQHVAAARTGHGPPFALLFLDFDHFKFVNDTLGHDAGDELLRQIAARLRKSLAAIRQPTSAPDRHAVSRFGGDEFVILLDDVPTAAHVPAAADRLLRDLAPAYTLRGVDVSSTASIGIVHSAADDDAEAMLRYADVAMYEAKRAGRGCWMQFDEAMRRRLKRVLQLERSLLEAIGTAQLRLVYQPVVELETGRVTNVEALLRWRHPTLGEVPPADFLPMAAESGLMVQLGEWVLEEACRQLVAWQRTDPARAPPAVSVNASRGELALGPRFVERVRQALAKSGLPARCLQIEVPGNDVLAGRAGATTALLEQLRALGVRVAMDEFGAGPATLSALRTWRFDSVKLAHSFVHGLATSRDVMALTHATLTLVENLGMASVAQGVEDPAQLAILQSFGCRYAQGRLLGSPAEADQALALAASISLERLEIAAAVLGSESAA